MSYQFMSIDKNTDLHNKEKQVWLECGFTDIRVETMARGIKEASVTEFVFIVINSDSIDFMPGLKNLREVTGAPILVATSNYSMEEQREALYNGADSYGIIGETSENMQMVMAILKRINERKQQTKPSKKLIINGNILIIPDQYMAYFGNVKISISITELKLLKYFLLKRGEILTYKQICKKVYDKPFEETSAALFNVTKRLRKKIKDATKQEYIETMKDVGYRFVRNDLP